MQVFLQIKQSTPMKKGTDVLRLYSNLVGQSPGSKRASVEGLMPHEKAADESYLTPLSLKRFSSVVKILLQRIPQFESI